MNELAERVLAGNRLALSRLLTSLENNTAEGESVLGELFPHTGRAHVVGITGSPGAGKSSLVNKLALTLRKGSPTQPPVSVGIIAVDPSSPFSGGALLGDRVRMRELSGDKGIFMRSMASRGAIGGLAASTARFAHAMDAAGFDVILIETVGAGQAEVEIAKLAHTTIVVEAPGMGDDIQANKAGILEIADILVLNKADLPEANQTYRILKAGLDLDANLRAGWKTPLLKVVSTDGKGVEQVAEQIIAHRVHLQENGRWNEVVQVRLNAELDLLLKDQLLRKWMANKEVDYQNTLQKIYSRQISPYTAVHELTKD